VSDHLTTTRRLAFRAIGWQTTAVVLAATMAWVVTGQREGLAVAVGGLSLVLGNVAMAQMSLGGGILPARGAYSRLLIGAVLKWLVVVGVWLVAMAVLKQAPVAALLGLLIAMVVHPVAILFGAKVKRER